ncbi:MAG: DUF2490 domain-containing protein [Muribaculaceae bacterium]|nr:DUF2490 domain-containing protein [Muribaculaceae bacterium]
MSNKAISFLAAALLCIIPVKAEAQSLWTSVEADYKLTKKWGLSAEGEYRTQDNFSNTERWAATISAEYKAWSHLKIAGGYTYIYQHCPNETTKKGNIIPQYWQPKHRAFFSLSGSYKWHNIEFSLRERYQYTYRPNQYVTKYDDDRITRKTDEIIKTKNQHVMRSRIQVEYDKKKCKFTPYASCELYNSFTDGFRTEKTRWTIGSSYKIDKKNSVDLYYRYNDENDDDNEGGHVIGIGYKFKL